MIGKIIFLFIVFVALMTEWAQAGLPPTTLKGQSGTKATTFNFEVPNHQATKTSTGGLIETGNKNRLKNPGFEHSTALTDWDSTTTGSTVLSSGVELTDPIEGKKSAKYICDGTAGAGTCSIWQDASTKYAMQGLVGVIVKSDTAWNESASTGVKVYSRLDGANTSKYLKIQDTSAHFRKIPEILGTTSTGVLVEITVAAGQSIEVLLDEGTVGAQDVKQDTAFLTTQSTRFSAGSTASGSVISGTPTTIGSGNYTVSSGVFTATRDINVSFSCRTTNSTTTSTQPTIFVNGVSTGMLANTANSNGYNSLTTFNGIVLSGQTFECREMNTTASSGSVSVLATNILNSSTYSSTNADTDWQSCGHTTSDFTGFGTVTNIETQCKRQGGDLLMKGKFSNGTGTATEARLALKFAGQSLTSKTTAVIPSIQSAGAYFIAATTANKGGAILIEPSVGYVTFGAPSTFNSTTVNASTKINGSGIGTGDTVSMTTIRIPIQGWENSNVIIGTFNEVVTTKGVPKVAMMSAKISSAGTVSNEVGDLFNGNCTLSSTSNFDCTFNTGNFSDEPNCSCSMDNQFNGTIVNTHRDCQIRQITSTEMDYATIGGATATAYGARIICHGVAP